MASNKADLFHSEFHADLLNGTFLSSHYAYTVEREGTNYCLTILTTSLSELDGEEDGIIKEYFYDSLLDVEHDTQIVGIFYFQNFDKI